MRMMNMRMSTQFNNSAGNKQQQKIGQRATRTQTKAIRPADSNNAIRLSLAHNLVVDNFVT